MKAEMSIKSRVRETVAFLLHELLIPINSLMGTHSILKDRVPQNISVLINDLGEASEKLMNDVQYLRLHIEQELKIDSPVKSASQIHQWVSRWKEYEIILSNVAQRLHIMMTTGFKIGNSQLDKILSNALFISLEQFKQQISYLGNIEGKDLIYGDHKQLSMIYQPQYQPPRESEQGFPMTSIARSHVYKLVYPLQGLEFGCVVFSDSVPQQISASTYRIGNCSEKFKNAVINFAEYMNADVDLTADKAVEQIHKQVGFWEEEYVIVLSSEIQQIRQMINSGIKVDEDCESIITGAFENAFNHLVDVMRQLKMIKSEDF